MADSSEGIDAKTIGRSKYLSLEIKHFWKKLTNVAAELDHT